MTSARLVCSVQTRFLPEQSDPAQSRYAYAYTVTLQNRGPLAAQLVARTWLIEEGGETTQEVRGLGVVGQQPLLGPGESHEYTSWVQLGHPQGRMRGHYLFVSVEAEAFEVEVPAFELAFANMLH
ncbi:Co2+/Mg2+ efflux protein ApaG [Piscinibacter sp. Jin2]|uniref:Co2+/Mg2+ efflux protein ApaG n=1 Tax=Aquariibacter lacus TaxID=2801332 RepID=A0A9X1BMQ3_9BURK|nr:Co2+/Mg2+ efflux protein ApaG [Piscinibacter lacus]MBL0718457.1 Co2+/Mg2+ efflux protein ApaG [Piscinibacter lacus]